MLTPSEKPALTLAPNPLMAGGNVRTVDVETLKSPAVLVRPKRQVKREFRELRAKQKADEAIAGLTRDVELYGFTKGQFSLLQLLEACLEKTGPVDFVLSTWTAARHEIQRLQALKESGKLLSVRWLVDFTFARRDPEAANQIRIAFGVDAIRVAQTHSKFATFANADWQLVLRTSMNLNMNPRFEDFTLSHDPQLYEHITRIVDEIWSRQKRELASESLRTIRHFWRDHM